MKNIVFIAIWYLLVNSLSAQIVDSKACESTADKSALKAFEKAEKTGGLEKVKLLNEIIAQYPDFHEAIFSQAMSLVKMDKYNQALARFEKVYALCPDYSPYTWYYIGAIYYGAEKYAEAMPFLEKASTYSGDLKFEDKDYDEAKAMLKASKVTAAITSKKVEFNPVAVKNICTEFDEYTAILSPDNELMYFIRKVKDARSMAGYREIFNESINSNWIFDRGRELPPPFNMSNNNGAATITADNKTMYFVMCQNNELNACDIWFSERKPTGWTTMTPVPGNLNVGTEWDSSPSVSFDGKEIIFVSKRPGGYGGTDLYISHKMPDGTWSKAENLGPSINTPENENTPFLHSDSKTLYFSSKGHNSLGGYDIYFSRQGADGAWSKPQNIGSPINTNNDEVSFFVSLDGKRGFFSSKNLNGPGGLDVYMFDLHEEAKPQQVKMIKGEIKSDLTVPKDAAVEIKNLRTKEIQKVEVDKEDGKYVALIDAKEDYVMTLKKEGMAFSSQLIEKDAPVENNLVKADLEMKKIETGKTYNINNINFATNSAELAFKSKAILEGFSDFLKTNPAIKVAIQGHTDDVGDDAANLLLSENRAKSVYEYLVGSGIPSNRLSYKGFGETQPVSSNDTEAGRAKNRRTEFLILSQ
jgi:outer membrane protein OmpA-like peptidoglycan-associated protein/Tol biopolymer transport system component